MTDRVDQLRALYFQRLREAHELRDQPLMARMKAALEAQAKVAQQEMQGILAEERKAKNKQNGGKG